MIINNNILNKKYFTKILNALNNNKKLIIVNRCLNFEYTKTANNCKFLQDFTIIEKTKDNFLKVNTIYNFTKNNYKFYENFTKENLKHNIKVCLNSFTNNNNKIFLIKG